MMFNILFANVFLLNYLVAILSTVYEDMMEMGDFAFKSNKYKYIERYNIAFKDQWGYSELIIHAPPINLTTLLLLPSVFNQNLMQSSSAVFSKANFWFENIFYILFEFLRELALVPFIFLRVLFSIITLAELVDALYLVVIWVTVGPFYLLWSVFEDIYYFLKILCDYKTEDDITVMKAAEDDKQDRIVIYNEIINVLKSLLLIFQIKQNKKLKLKAKLSTEKFKAEMKLNEALLIFESLGDKAEDEGYMLDKQIIIEAWARYRPVQREGDENAK